MVGIIPLINRFSGHVLGNQQDPLSCDPQLEKECANLSKSLTGLWEWALSFYSDTRYNMGAKKHYQRHGGSDMPSLTPTLA